MLVAAALMGGGAALVGDSSPNGERGTAHVRVLRVVDGDTILVRMDGRRERVRYIGIDTPESVAPGQPVECYGPAAARENRRLVGGRSVVVADSGLVPPPAYAAHAHASALAFEFSYGTELIVGNCGPAPAELPDGGLVFRQGLAHSGLTVNGASAARVKTGGPFAGRVLRRGAQGEVETDEDDESLLLTTHGYEARYGATIERRLTLLAEGKSLVGQDHLIVPRRGRREALAIARFHLALGTTLEPGDDDDMLRLRLASGAVWSFLWEGAAMRIEDSVRQSSYFGFHRIRQIVLEAPLEDDHEIAWIFTLDEHRHGKAYNPPQRQRG